MSACAWCRRRSACWSTWRFRAMSAPSSRPARRCPARSRRRRSDRSISRRSSTRTTTAAEREHPVRLAKDLVARFALPRTMARPDFSALGGSISADDTDAHRAIGGNPDLKPIRSTNFDATIEWYFAPKSLLAAGLFYMDLTNYVGFGNHDVSAAQHPHRHIRHLRISSPINSSGKVKGIELAYQQSLRMASASRRTTPMPMRRKRETATLVGASKNTYNVVGYYENYGFSARLAYTYRSHFFVGLDRSTPEYQDDTGTLAASLGYTINDNVTLTFDALNLNNPTLKYYGATRTSRARSTRTDANSMRECASSSESTLLPDGTWRGMRRPAIFIGGFILSMLRDHPLLRCCSRRCAPWRSKGAPRSVTSSGFADSVAFRLQPVQIHSRGLATGAADPRDVVDGAAVPTRRGRALVTSERRHGADAGVCNGRMRHRDMGRHGSPVAWPNRFTRSIGRGSATSFPPAAELRRLHLRNRCRDGDVHRDGMLPRD